MFPLYMVFPGHCLFLIRFLQKLNLCSPIVVDKVREVQLLGNGGEMRTCTSYPMNTFPWSPALYLEPLLHQGVLGVSHKDWPL